MPTTVIAGDVYDSQVSVGTETGYGAGAVPNRGIELVQCNVKLDYATIASKAHVKGHRAQSARRTSKVFNGASASIGYEALDKGLGFWLKQILPNVVIAAHPTVPAAKVMTFTPGSQKGTSFGLEVASAFGNENGLALWRFNGGKVVELKGKLDRNDMLRFDIAADFRGMQSSLDGITKTPSIAYPTDADFFTSRGGQILLDRLDTNPVATLCANSIEFGIKTGLGLDTAAICDGGLKHEPTAIAKLEATASASVVFETWDNFKKYTSALAEGREVSLRLIYETASDVTPGVKGRLEVEFPVADMDGEAPSVGLGTPTETLKFDARSVSGTPEIRIKYTTTDTAP